MLVFLFCNNNACLYLLFKYKQLVSKVAKIRMLTSSHIASKDAIAFLFYFEHSRHDLANLYADKVFPNALNTPPLKVLYKFNMIILK